MSKKNTAGGAAATGGIEFQARVAAWMAVQILAEQDASPSWKLAARTTLKWLRCETEEPVDDLLVATSDGGFVFVQVKHSVSLSANGNSRLASVFQQFVSQFLAHPAISTANQRWQRPLEVGRDRLVLIVGSAAPTTIYHDLQMVTQRIAGLPAGQPLDSAALNARERHAYQIAVRHLRGAWLSTLGTKPLDEDIRQITSLCYIQMLDVDSGGLGEREAKHLLRHVLADTNQTDAAWAVLVAYCTGLAASRSGADRPVLQQELLRAGIALQATPSYRRDIQQLQEHSTRTRSLLRDLSIIRVGSEEVKIKRSYAYELQRASTQGELLVVGEPGAGKSGALLDLAELLARSNDVLFLAVDRLTATSQADLSRELNLDHELTEVIANWLGAGPAFLVIDALDAARAEPAAQALRDLIKIVIQDAGRWRVICSVRKFDLRYSPVLKELFRGKVASEFVEAEFADIRHLSVRKLSREELDQIEPQSPRLYSLVNAAPQPLLELLSVPFNLRLIADLLGAGVQVASLTPLRTQLELLERHWQHRVIQADGQGDAREDVLRRACESMVQHRRLRVARAEIADATTSGPLYSLLREHVLIEWQPSPEAGPDRYFIAFSHHVLFDYAVERLLLRVESEALIARLATDRDQILVVRPSFELHFEHLWGQQLDSHGQFWRIVLTFAHSHEIPEIGKVIGPAVAARRALKLAELEPLCALVESRDGAQQVAAEAALRHLIGAVLAQAEDGQQLTGANAGPWCALLERVSRELRESVVYSLRPLLFRVCYVPNALTSDQLCDAGKAARRVLEFSWQLSPRDSTLVIHGLDCVCKTFESDMAQSAALIYRALDIDHVKQFGFEELPWLARHVGRLIPLDAEIVQRLYMVTFSHREDSTEATHLFGSNIITLQSHRRQDFAMAYYGLSAAFPAFLQQAPAHAVEALVSAMESFVAREHPLERVQEEVFAFNGEQARIRSDLSAIWDANHGVGHQDAVMMLDAFEKHLDTLGADAATLAPVREIVRVVATANRLACIWRRLLRVGARLPGTIGSELLPLAVAAPILTFLDTRYLAGEFLAAIFPLLHEDYRERIERILLSLPTDADDEDRGERDRTRLFSCLPASLLVTREARELVESLHRAGAIQPNLPDFQFGPVRSSPIKEEDYLIAGGVPIEEPVNRNLLALADPVKRFAEAYGNQSPPPNEVTAIIPDLRALADALALPGADALHPRIHMLVMDALAEASARIVAADGFSCSDDAGALLTAILLQSSRHSEPRYRPEFDDQFDSHPTWGKPSPRVEGALGLMHLARIPGCATTEILEDIVRLSRDLVPAVRLQIAVRLTSLSGTASGLMWTLLEQFCKEETSQGVLVWLLEYPLHRLAASHAGRVTTLVKGVYVRVEAWPSGPAIRKACVNLLAQLYIWMDQDGCKDFVLEIASQPSVHPNEAEELVRVLRTPLRHGKSEDRNSEEAAIRARAWALVSRLVSSARTALMTIETAHRGLSSSSAYRR